MDVVYRLYDGRKAVGEIKEPIEIQTDYSADILLMNEADVSIDDLNAVRL